MPLRGVVGRTPCGILEAIDLLDLRGVDALEHQLGHAVADLDCHDGKAAMQRQQLGRRPRASALRLRASQASGSGSRSGWVPWRGRVAGRTLEVVLAMVEEDHADVTAVVGVDHARARVDEVLPCQARARRCTQERHEA